MIAVLQRVTSATVAVEGELVAAIDGGLLALVAAVRGDTVADAEALALKIATLRVFADADGRMNLGLADVGGALLLVSQFTLAADMRRGRRPSFENAMAPHEAQSLLQHLAAVVAARGIAVQTGRFGASMQVELVNDGPVTLLMDSRASRAGGDGGREPAS